MIKTYTPAEFAAEFPRACGHKDAIRYVAIDCHPNRRPTPGSIEVGENEKAVLVGWANKSRTKAIVRFAVIPGE